MDWITEEIALAGVSDWPESFAGAGIEAVLQIYWPDAEAPPVPDCAVVRHLPFDDGKAVPVDLLVAGIDFIREQRALGRKVLVTCGRGMSRSPTLVAAYLHEEGSDLGDAFRLILSRRACVLPHPEMLRSLVEHYGLEVRPEVLLADLVRARRDRRLAEPG